jgi:tRNA (guanine37-N1)-methyltransferase
MDKNSQLRDMNLFRAPAARAAKSLDRSLFTNTLNAAAASIRENKLLSKYRKELEKTNEVLFMERFNPILPDPNPSLASEGKKCIVLAPQIKSTSPETWSPILQEAAKVGDIKVVPYDIEIGYEFWSYSKPDTLSYKVQVTNKSKLML